MKPYKNPNKFIWRCPICFEEKRSGGQGHIRAQACGHMRNEHDIYEFADYYQELGFIIARNWDDFSEAQKQSINSKSIRTDKT